MANKLDIILPFVFAIVGITGIIFGHEVSGVIWILCSIVKDFSNKYDALLGNDENSQNSHNS